MAELRYTFSRNLPLGADADVPVAGGGPGGLGAAVMAARAGATTVLVERYGYLGGMAASGEVHPFMPNHVRGRSMDTPVYTEWARRIHAYLPPELRERMPFDEAIPSQRERMLSKRGFTAARAACYVDCTGDGDLAAQAGCAYEEGGPTGHSQPMTLCFTLSHVDRKRMPPSDELNRPFDAAKARGELSTPRDNVLHFAYYD